MSVDASQIKSIGDVFKAIVGELGQAEKPVLRAAAKTAVHVAVEILKKEAESLTQDQFDSFIEMVAEELDSKADELVDKVG